MSKRRISKIKIKNLFGIKEYELDGGSFEFSGENGVGKTSIIDSIKFALENKSDKDYIVRNGADEGEIIIETTDGLFINRRPKPVDKGYKSIKQNGEDITKPESFLKDIFTPMQLNPVEFIQMDKNKQNSIILDLIKYDWSINTIKEWFGEIVPGVDYEQNILKVLNDIQSEDGYYYQKRQELNRDIKNKQAFIDEVISGLPDEYNADDWENKDLSELYTSIEKIRNDNDAIEKAKLAVESRDNKVRAFDAEREIALSALDREFATRENQINEDVQRLEAELKALITEKSGMIDKKKDKAAVIESDYKSKIAKFDAEIDEYKQHVSKEPVDYSELSKEAKNVEKMKSYINEYRRMEDLKVVVENLDVQSLDLSVKINKARTLPGEILETAEIPIEGITVENGIPLINGLPISNLSEGQKLSLCVDVTVQQAGALQIILIDGVEKLSMKNREKLYNKCKEKGLQMIATRTTDDVDLTVIEL